MINLDIIYFDLTGCETSVNAPSRFSGPFPFSLLSNSLQKAFYGWL